MVRETGLEPARPRACAPKAHVYTNFTTRAKILHLKLGADCIISYFGWWLGF